MANSASSVLRMAGMNSGFDTESIVKALTATTKNKINTNERKLMKLGAQQEAYRDIIDSFNQLKDKYLDVLNRDTYLMSPTLFNSYKSSLTNDAGTTVKGVTASSTTYATPGSYDVEVNQVATQAYFASNGVTGSSVKLDNCADGTSYTMKVTVGNKSKQIVFTAGADEAATKSNINAALKDAFGTTTAGENVVKIGDDNRFTTSDRSAVVSTSAVEYSNRKVLDYNVDNIKKGSNTLSITVGDVTKSVTFSTVDKGYFDDIFIGGHVAATDAEMDEAYKAAHDKRAEEIWSTFTDADKEALGKTKEEYIESFEGYTRKEFDEKLNLFEDVVQNQWEEELHDQFTAWEEGITTDTDKEALSENIFRMELENRVEISKKAYYEDARSAKAEAAYKEAEAAGTLGDKTKEDFIAEYDGYSMADFEADLASGIPAAEITTDTELNEKLKKAITECNDTATNIRNTEYTDDKKAAYKFEKLSYEQKFAYYEKKVYNAAGADPANQGVSNDDFLASFDAEKAAKSLNRSNLKNNIEALGFDDAKLEVSFTDDGKAIIEGTPTAEAPAGYDGSFGITSAKGNATPMGAEVATTDTTGSASQVSVTTKLSELGLTPNADGNYTFSINNKNFSFDGDTTISSMMKKVNSSGCGATMSFTTLTNQFKITAAEYGKDGDIKFKDGDQKLLQSLGFAADSDTAKSASQFTTGTNSILKINGYDIETQSNSYTVDGTTFTFTQAAEGTKFNNTVERDTSKAAAAIKSFVEDYNALIKKVYGYVDDKPNKDYYFLTDSDKEDMDLSESQEEKWEKLAKKGIIYHDSTVSNIMTKMRSALMGSVELASGDGTLSIFNIGLGVSSSWKDHGLLSLDEEKLNESLMKYPDEIASLFADPEKGIMAQLSAVIDSAVKTTGDRAEKGLLVQKAGVEATSSETDNSIFDEMTRIQDLLDSLNERYEQQQERWWKIYGNMETQLGNINGQSSYISQLIGSNG